MERLSRALYALIYHHFRGYCERTVWERTTLAVLGSRVRAPLAPPIRWYPNTTTSILRSDGLFRTMRTTTVAGVVVCNDQPVRIDPDAAPNFYYRKSDAVKQFEVFFRFAKPWLMTFVTRRSLPAFYSPKVFTG